MRKKVWKNRRNIPEVELAVELGGKKEVQDKSEVSNLADWDIDV